jgi:2,3-bisphosphoglycerate-independent phosphoglycerate mutase
MKSPQVTVLAEQLAELLAAAQPGLQSPALETILARADRHPHVSSDPDELRFELFGVKPVEELPIGALTYVADHGTLRTGNDYCLRADPVTLWADMARVIMTSYGFADLDKAERDEIECTIRAVLMEEGMDFGSSHPERWTIALERPLGFTFPPLREALGVDLGEVLPEHPEALRWRRILNEIQVALHACPVNVKRRREGRQEINSVWFWGGGYLPAPSDRTPFCTVFSNRPVSRGLALVHGCELMNLGDTAKLESRVASLAQPAKFLIDWSPRRGAAQAPLVQLESLALTLLGLVKHQRVTLDFYAGNGSCWRLNHLSVLRWWRRRRPPNLILQRH